METDQRHLPENLRKFLLSEDPAMRLMGLSMVKGTGIPEEVYKNVFGLSLWDPEEENREAAGELVEEIGLKNITEFPGWLEPFGLPSVPGSVYVDSDVCDAAVETLGKIGDTRAVEPLIEVLGDEEGFEERIYAAEALGKIGDTRAVEPLIEVLGVDEVGDCDLCEAATEALGKIGDARAVEPLIEVFSHVGVFDDFDHTYAYSFRICAAEALGEIGDTRAVDPLIEVLESEERLYGTDPLIAQNLPHIRKAAMKALKKLGHEVE